MTQVVLAIAPFLTIQIPALGPALLEGQLKARGIRCRSRYLNLEYMEREGLDFTRTLAEGTRAHFLLGEWVFAPFIHADGRTPDLEIGMDWAREKAEAPLFKAMVRARNRAGEFLDASARSLVDEGAAIIGLSSTFQQTCASLALAARVKALSPQTLICLGGANAEGEMGATLAATFPQLDLVFSGESDHTFPDVVADYLETGARPDTRLIHGRPIDRMDDLPDPEYDAYFETLAKAAESNRVVPALPFESSRGCWWGAKHHCAFCGLNGDGMGYRQKSPDAVAAQLGRLRSRWPVTHFAASDNILSMGHVTSLLGADRPELADLEFFYEVKSNLTADQLATLRRGGVTWIQPGIESLDDDILSLMSKGVTGIRNIWMLRAAAEVGLRVSWNILVGFPGEQPESYETMARTLERIQHLEAPVGVGEVRIDRFSPFHTDPERWGFGPPRPTRAMGQILDLPEVTRAGLAYFFEADRLDGRRLADYLSPLVEAYNRWLARAGERGADKPARLRLKTLGPLRMVEDTRDMAQEALRPLSENEQAVLAAFDRPRDETETLTALAKAWTGPKSPEETYGDLDALGYVIRLNGKALTLVTDPARTVAPRLHNAKFPGGNILPKGLIHRNGQVLNAETLEPVM